MQQLPFYVDSFSEPHPFEPPCGGVGKGPEIHERHEKLLAQSRAPKAFYPKSRRNGAGGFMMQLDKKTALVGERMRKLRLERGHNTNIADEISKKYRINLTSGGLSRMERGRSEISVQMVLMIADFYGVSPGHLVDPTHEHALHDFDFILKDKDLLEKIAELGRALGPAGACEHIKAHLKQMEDILTSRDSD